MEPLKILISAYSCRPNMGSEPGVGWNTACEVAKYEQVWVVTREDNRPFIEANQTPLTPDHLHFVYCDVPGWLRGWCKSGTLLHYYLWQVSAYLTLRQLLPKLPFDVIHHVTYVRYSTPSFLSFLPVPFIWGSVGGGETAPSAFWKDFNLRARLYEFARGFAHWLGEKDPFTRITAERSALVRVTTEDTAQRLRKIARVEPEIFPESALATDEIQALSQYPEPPNEPIRFISMARLLHWKGLHLSIRSFASAALPGNAEYWICGDGPEQKNLETLAASLGVADRVKFWGRLPRDETLERLSQCHVLIHTSLHDSGGWVCVEAMAMGRPVVCLDLGGPSTQVTEKTGFKVPAETPEQVIEEVAIALAKLAQDAELRHQMGQAGQCRVNEIYNWQARGQHLSQLYRTIIKQEEKSVSDRISTLC